MSITPPILVAPNGFRSQSVTGSLYNVYTVVPGYPPIIDITRGMVYLDNYFFFAATTSSNGNDPNNTIYGSAYSGDPYGPWDTTSYVLAQEYVGEISWLDKHHNYLVAFCSNSIEFFYDAGNGLGSPLARQPIYAKQIGILNCGLSTTIAKDKDDIYFIGKNSNNYYDIYKLSNFMCQPVGSHYVREVLNYFANGKQSQIYGIETMNIDSHTMIVISFYGVPPGVSTSDSPGGMNLALVYFPEEGCWWSLNTADLWQGGNLRTNLLMLSQQASTTQRPYYITGTLGSSTIQFNTTDLEGTISNTASYYSEVIDLDTNHWKHISKLHSVGDYGNNTLTLWYCNDPTYTTFTKTSTKSPLADGYQNAIWWDNVTRFRRGSFRIDMTGIGPAHHRAFDIEYRMGSA